MDTLTKEDLAGALFDVLDGQSNWYQIQEATGCSEERCKEISAMFMKIYQHYDAVINTMTRTDKQH